MPTFCPYYFTDNSSLTSCRLDYITSINWGYRTAQISHVITGVLGVYFSMLYMLKYSSKHILPPNIKVFMSITVAATVVHSVTLTALHIVHLVQSYRAVATDPCTVKNTVGFCAAFRYPYTICVFLLVLNQYSMCVDRILETYNRKYGDMQEIILYLSLSIEFIIAIGLAVFVYRNEMSSDYLLSCINVPQTSIIDISIITATFLPINCICLVFSIVLFQSNKKNIQRSRFDIIRHFNASMNLDALVFLRLTTMTQAIIIVLYSIAILIVRLSSYATPNIFQKTIATLAYIINYYCVLVPIVMIYAVNQYQTERKKKINSVISVKTVGSEGSDNYFNSLKNQWEQKIINIKI